MLALDELGRAGYPATSVHALDQSEPHSVNPRSARRVSIFRRWVISHVSSEPPDSCATLARASLRTCSRRAPSGSSDRHPAYIQTASGATEANAAARAAG